MNQFIEGNRLVLEPVEDVESLAGSLGKGKKSTSVEVMKAAARKSIANAAVAGSDDLVCAPAPATIIVM